MRRSRGRQRLPRAWQPNHECKQATMSRYGGWHKLSRYNIIRKHDIACEKNRHHSVPPEHRHCLQITAMYSHICTQYCSSITFCLECPILSRGLSHLLYRWIPLQNRFPNHTMPLWSGSGSPKESAECGTPGLGTSGAESALQPCRDGACTRVRLRFAGPSEAAESVVRSATGIAAVPAAGASATLAAFEGAWGLGHPDLTVDCRITSRHIT